jgi:ABC-type branched-subunit amino acid transport system substrate-binding protein
VAAPASLDSQWVHEAQLLPIGGPYQVQSANALTWYAEGGNGGARDDVACALVRDDRYGEAGLEGFEAAAATIGVDLAEVVTFAAGEVDFAPHVEALGAARCEVVLFVGLPVETGAAMAEAAAHAPPFDPQWIAQSPAWLGQLAHGELGQYLQEHLVVVGEGTEWGDTSVPGMAQLLEDAPPGQAPSLHFAFGYAQARAVHQILEAAVAAGDLSRAGVAEALAAVEVLTFDGLLGDYGYGSPEDRDPPRASTIFAVDPEVPGGLGVLEAGVISEAAEELDL